MMLHSFIHTSNNHVARNAAENRKPSTVWILPETCARALFPCLPIPITPEQTTEVITLRRKDRVPVCVCARVCVRAHAGHLQLYSA